MAVKFSYGLRGEQLIHVSDLDRESERGLPCNCLCRECRQPLQAHLGARKAWHFQHQAKDSNCNPQPMTLLHAFVRDELAKLTFLAIPALRVPVEFEEVGRTWSTEVEVPAVVLNILRSETEYRAEDVQPDVFFELDNQTKFALEVRYSHSVDEDKRKKLRMQFSQSVEFDVSDLPSSGVGRSELERLLAEPHRWRWLVNGRILWEQSQLRQNIRWTHSLWRLKALPNSVPEAAKSATKKLKMAQAKLGWAKAELRNLRHRQVDAQTNASWLGNQDKVDRVAIACAALGLEPANLPVYFTQQVKGRNVSAFGHHPYSWQVIVFMKFGIGGESFSAKDAATWCRVAMADRVEPDNGAESLNHFTRGSALLQTYFLDLEAQGLLHSDGNRVLESRIFMPRFESAADFRRRLPSLPVF